MGELSIEHLFSSAGLKFMKDFISFFSFLVMSLLVIYVYFFSNYYFILFYFAQPCLQRKKESNKPVKEGIN